jgi:trans-aconitate methyltransferase
LTIETDENVRGRLAARRARAAARRGLARSSCTEDMHAGERLRMPLAARREAVIQRLCAQAAPGEVAHIGCTDSPYTAERLAGSALLHQQLVRLASVTGFDIDADALEMLSRALPSERFVLADLAAHIPDSERRRYQLVVAGEVLEHVPNADAFLLGCHELTAEQGRICVTVPNACSPKIGIRALAGREMTHPDHRTYYGPRTLARTLRGAGFEVEWMASCLAPAGTIGRLVYHPALKAAHKLFQGPVGEGLIAVAGRV